MNAKRILSASLLYVWLCISGTTAARPSMVRHLSQYWKMDFPHQTEFLLDTDQPSAQLILDADSTREFTLRMMVDTRKPESDITILSVPGMLAVRLFNAADSHSGQNYGAFPMSDGSVPVLEGTITLHSPLLEEKVREMKVGVPLGMLEKPIGQHDVVFQFTGVSWKMYVDNRLVDCDSPIGYPATSKVDHWQIVSDYVKSASWYTTAITPQRDEGIQMSESEFMYFLPPTHNTWVGDVVSCFYQGRYHLFYLLDRRNHGSKFGRGGHYFEHLSTKDFKTWTEHHPAVTLDNQYETIGTGTAFVYQGQMYLSYGLHTTRIVPEEKTLLPMQWDYYNQHGYTGSFLTDTIPGLYPAGSSYGIWDERRDAFVKSDILFHPCENPSIHVDEQGKLTLLANYHAKGTWSSDSIQGGWKCVDENFPPGGDCTFPFRWNDYDYIVGGFHGMWYKWSGESRNAYRDMTEEGTDFYNGLGVPTMTQLPDGRFLMAGWLGMKRWGGPLMVYEMVQKPDGQLGTRWMKELIPETEAFRNVTSEVKKDGIVYTNASKFMLTFEVVPQEKCKGRLAVQFLSDQSSEVAREWQLSLEEKRAQYSNAEEGRYAKEEKTIGEGGNPNDASDYAISHLTDIDKPFTVRMVVKGTDKLAGSLIDTEIARQRTMLNYQGKLFVSHIKFLTEGVRIKNVKIANLVH